MRPDLMTPEQRERWLLGCLAVAEEHPVYAAIMELLAADVKEARDTTSNVLVAEKHGALAHAAGGMAWLTNLQERIESLRETAMGEGKKQADLEAQLGEAEV